MIDPKSIGCSWGLIFSRVGMLASIISFGMWCVSILHDVLDHTVKAIETTCLSPKDRGNDGLMFHKDARTIYCMWSARLLGDVLGKPSNFDVLSWD